MGSSRESRPSGDHSGTGLAAGPGRCQRQPGPPGTSRRQGTAVQVTTPDNHSGFSVQLDSTDRQLGGGLRHLAWRGSETTCWPDRWNEIAPCTLRPDRNSAQSPPAVAVVSGSRSSGRPAAGADVAAASPNLKLSIVGGRSGDLDRKDPLRSRVATCPCSDRLARSAGRGPDRFGSAE